MEKPETFEEAITSYGQGPGEHVIDKFTAISEILSDVWGMGRNELRTSPAESIRAAFVGNLLRVTYHTYVMHLPSRQREIEEESKKCLDEAVKFLKKKYKERTKSALKLKELKDKANFSVQKVSLNERYMYVCWRFFELGD